MHPLPLQLCTPVPDSYWGRYDMHFVARRTNSRMSRTVLILIFLSYSTKVLLKFPQRLSVIYQDASSLCECIVSVRDEGAQLLALEHIIQLEQQPENYRWLMFHHALISIDRTRHSHLTGAGCRNKLLFLSCIQGCRRSLGLRCHLNLDRKCDSSAQPYEQTPFSCLNIGFRRVVGEE